jgi:Smg protein
MKENIIDVLMFLFEHYMDDDMPFEHDQDVLTVELVEAGFPSYEVNKAFEWLEGLAEQQFLTPSKSPQTQSMRVYLPQECERLNIECRGFLLFLEQVGILDNFSRELVIDRIMALEAQDVSLEQLKWVILMVLFNQPGQEEAFVWMEDLVYNNAISTVH